MHGISLVLLLWGVLGLSSAAKQVVTIATHAALADALQQGGPIRLDFDGIVVITNTILVSRDAQLDASGHNVTLDGRGAHRMFAVETASLIVSNVTFQNGGFRGARAIATTNSSRKAAQPGTGGAMRISEARLELIGCTFSNNVARGGAAAVYSLYGLPDFVVENGAGAFGGAIYSEESFVTVRNCRFVNNRVVGSMPLLYPIGGKSLSTEAGSAQGGSIFATNSFLTVIASTFSGEEAASYDSGDRGARGEMVGGAIAARTCFTLLRDDLFIQNGAGNMNHGGRAIGGAGYFVDGALRVERSLFLSNSATAGPNSDAGGGALWLDTGAVIESSSFIGNSVLAGPAGIVGFGTADGGTARGGAIAAFSGLVLSNSTLAFNRASGASNGYGPGPSLGAAYGGAVYSSNPISLAFSTLLTNQVFPPMAAQFEAPAAAGGLFATNGAVRALANVFAGNSRTNLIGEVLDYGANFSSDAHPIFQGVASANGVDPRLGPMKMLFERFYFFPPLPGSPVINRISSHYETISDQLGFPREFRFPDSGAIEWQGESPKLEVVTGRNGLSLRLYDPAYAFRTLQISHDLQIWSPLPFGYEQPLSSLAAYAFFRVSF